MSNASEKQGKLKHWNEEKGFGFIALKNEPKDIFIHISSLKKMSRRPIIGDIITFKIHIDNNGKKRATDAIIKGVSSVDNIKKKKYKKTNSNNILSKVAVFILLVLVGYFLYSVFSKIENAPTQTKEKIIMTPKESQKLKSKNVFSCQGKVYCSQMTSCSEAKFYLNNCKGTKIDGNGDGVPCEKQWCN